MTLEEFIAMLQKKVEQEPALADAQVVGYLNEAPQLRVIVVNGKIKVYIQM